MEFIMLRLKDGTIVIHGGYDLKLDAKDENLVVENSLVEIIIKPPLTKEEITNLLEEIREKFGSDAAEKLSNLLKTIPISAYSD